MSHGKYDENMARDINSELIADKIYGMSLEQLFEYLKPHLTDPDDPLLHKIQDVAFILAEDLYPEDGLHDT
jgi:hypothetical protein